MRLCRLPAEAVRPLRRAVLRPHQDEQDVGFPGDDLPGTLHVGAREDDGELVGVASVSPEPHPRDPRAGDWRLRGMATAPAARGRGHGAALLGACLEHVRTQGGRRVWCTARTPARAFYERAGFVAVGEEFDAEGIGPHILMALELR